MKNKKGIASLFIKPVMQGGRLNYLGNQKFISAPFLWKSGPSHPITHLAYITDEEEKILVKLNLYNSMNGKPNIGPFGIPSLNDGDGSGGDSGGASGGSGGSDASGDAGNATGDSAGVGGSGDSTDGAGAGSGPGGESGTGGIGGSAANDSPTSNETNEDQDEDQEDQEEEQAPAAPSMARLSPIGITAYNMSLANPTKSTAEKAAGFAMSPIGTIAATIADTSMRGVTAPDDYSQVQESVQSSATSSTDSGGTPSGTSQKSKEFLNEDDSLDPTKRIHYYKGGLSRIYHLL